ncbi:hypothetical protein [Yimella sp. cx-51]|uniref:hypothetical protein n=1 Tax=Yimella sp. cx-51 TaxID=2770551 RepID=UPI00165EB98D|nr:hypothetical protein [Yimella sp. cx-51]MBC9955812.1 hypothetical protein [Yimella sp. cx-51]QTH37635.1 hypothetical protein J5M86_12305 [Yimella sp. cx-51]
MTTALLVAILVGSMLALAGLGAWSVFEHRRRVIRHGHRPSLRGRRSRHRSRTHR